MTDFNLLLAKIPVGVHVFYESTRQFCRDYLTDEPPCFEVTMKREDIELMRQLSAETDIAEGHKVYHHSDEYLETIALYRKIVDELLHYDILLFHGSVMATGGKAYMFTAKSGTGKTTHSRLWLKNFPECHVLNGDKPLFFFRDGEVYACGTPWRGKENYGINEVLPLEAICILERGEENSIEKISFKDAFVTLTAQSHHPAGNAGLIGAMQLIGKLSAVSMYRLRCNMEDEAAFVSYHGMVKK